MSKNKVKTDKTDDNATYKRVRRIGQTSCVFCPPWKGENAPRGRKEKYPDKHKNKRRETIRKNWNE